MTHTPVRSTTLAVLAVLLLLGRAPGAAEDKSRKEDKTAIPDPAVVKANKEEITGVFIVTPDNKVEFRKVDSIHRHLNEFQIGFVEHRISQTERLCQSTEQLGVRHRFTEGFDEVQSEWGRCSDLPGP